MQSNLKSLIGAEKLSRDITTYMDDIKENNTAKKKPMLNILIHIEDVFRNVERTQND